MRASVPLLLVVPLIQSCGSPPGCIATGSASCVVPSPCEAVSFTCEAGGYSEIGFVSREDPVPQAIGALQSPGDVYLENEQVRVVIDALDHPHYLGPTGGSMLDAGTTGDDNDSMRQLTQATGLLPGDIAHYTEVKLVEEGDIKAVQYSGHLEGYEDVRIHTRYEIRPCEPGVRVRTELVSDHPNPRTMYLGDGWYWGGRESLAFTPTPGAGFEHPSFGLTDVGDAIRTIPYMVAGARVEPSVSYSVVACDREAMQGFQSEEISYVGTEPRVVMPGDYEVFERFVGIAEGQSVAGAADIALEVRRQLFDEPWVELSGTVAIDGGGGGLGRVERAQVTLSEGAPTVSREERIPWSHVVPDEDGAWTVRVPPNRTYTLEVEAFGAIVATGSVDVGGEAATADEILLPPAGEIVVDATLDGESHLTLAFIRPAGVPEEDAFGQFLGHFDRCAPMLGHPHGNSPACDRLLVEGPTPVLVKPGTYDVFSVAGPFSTLARVDQITVTDGSSTPVLLEMQRLDLQPEGVMSGDFHVHGGQSFDIAFGNEDRVRSFLAADIDVIATTEHTVVADYASMVAEKGWDDRIKIMDGTESTGAILFDVFEDASFPKVVGHWNFWPVPYDAHGPWRGAPWDQMVQPAGLMDRAVSQGWDAERGVAQLNHPFGGFQFGRDFGWAETLGMNLNEPLEGAPEGSGQATFTLKPEGSAFSNHDFHAQEVMNGSANAGFLPYRALWFYLLSEGVPRAGTANSDTHSLTENITGFPRNLVWSDTSHESWSPLVYNQAIREGRMVGTNGPVIELSLEAPAGTMTPSLIAFDPGSTPTLDIRISAAPWVPVDEVRIYVNGEVVQTLTELTQPADDQDVATLVRLEQSVDISSYLPASGDAWVVVEAGTPLPETADLDCNGFPDTTDNNGDGTIDWRDVDGQEEEPEACEGAVGPLTEPEPPQHGERGYAYSVVVPNGYSTAFTNPLLLDLDGNGYAGVAR